MALIINHNISALTAHHNLSASANAMGKSIEKLSSGFRINVGADDPSGLIISEQLRSQISGLERAVRNSSEAYNLIGIAEGALNEMNSILKKMRALAIHAANNGITSPDQVAADQAEMDSGIQTLDRIANTTRYSDQYLLNGAKQLVYDVTTDVNEPTDHALLDTKLTRVDQIFKRDGYKLGISFTGSTSAWQANTKTSAQRAYLEADAANSLCQISGASVTARQEFILTGTSGSRLFSFAEGTHIGTIVDNINNVRDSTGVGATLTFASDVRVDQTANGTPDGRGPDYPSNTRADYVVGYNDGTYVYRTGDVQVYGAGTNNVSDSKIACVCLTPNAAAAFRVGYNCDGDGKIYAKVVDKDNNIIEYYKDKNCTMLIGKGDQSFFAATNNSDIPSAPMQNLDGLFITLTDNAENLDVFEIAVVGQRMDNQKDMEINGLPGWADIANSVMSGVNLGVNTSPQGELFFKYTPLSWEIDGCTVRTFKVEVFNHSSMEPKYLVAESGTVLNCIANAATAGTGPYGQTITIESVIMDNGEHSGLNITMNLPKPPYTGAIGPGAMPSGEMVGDVSFTNLGMRLYSTDYGSAGVINIQNNEGELFYYYRESNTQEKVMVKNNTTTRVSGQDAYIGINGAPVYTQGLVANVTTPDFAGSLVFNAGKLGECTLAVAGYEDGKLYSRATDLQGVEENENTIASDRRHFEPPSLTYAMGGGGTGLNDKLGQSVNIYLDFSQADVTVEGRIAPSSAARAVTMEYNAATGMLIIDANLLGTAAGVIAPVSIRVDPEKLKEGFYITDPSLRGVYIKSETLINMAASTTSSGPHPQNIVADGGNNLLEVRTYATNPRGDTTESCDNFQGGMQFQLGNTEGDQDRTIYSIQSMSMANLGRITYNGTDYCLQHVLGGGIASLSKDPVLAMRIISQAADDVSTLRARLGAFQSNMLQTNINSLNVAIENITKTEAAIRDTDMAAETTEFTRSQIMQQAGTSMLAQANQSSQNVLSLLQ